MGWSAAVGLLLGVWAFWPPRPSLGDAEEPESSPPIARLTISVLPDDPARALAVPFRRGMSSMSPHYAMQRRADESLGTHTLLARAVNIPPPPTSLRRHLSQLGLRPADLSRSLADVWPRGAAAAVMVEARWAQDDWQEDYDGAVQAFVTKHGRHPTDSGKLTLAQQQEWIAMWPSLRFPSVRAAASELADSADPWVDEVAWAYTFAHTGWEDRELLALDLLARDASPHLLDLAMTGLQTVRVPLTDDTEALLRRVAAERPEHAAQLGVYGFEAAILAGDVDRAAAFLPMIEENLAHVRSEWLADAISEGVDRARGQLAARGGGPVESWRAGLIVLAHRCAEQIHQRRSVRGQGIFDMGWRWQMSDDDAFTRCFAGTEPPGPPPPEGQRVDVTIRVVPQ